MLVFEAILKNTMKMNSLRSPAPIILLTLLLSLAAPNYPGADAAEQNSKKPSSQLPIAPAIDSAPAGADSAESDSSKIDNNSAAKSSSKDAKSNSPADSEQVEESKQKGLRGFLKRKKKESESDSTEGGASSDDASKKGTGTDSKAAKDPKEEKEAPPPPLSKEQKEAAEKRAAQQTILKSMTTPFSTSFPTPAITNSGSAGAISLTGNASSLRSRGLGQRFSQNRVFLPPKMIIGRIAEFVVKGRPGSKVAIAMADKDSGAKAILGHDLRLGPDRKVVGGGVIPETGVLTVYVEMPIQGDLIGLPVFFETALWQKSDFSDLEIANPVKSETVEEIADKPNGILVSEEKAEQKRGLRFVPDSSVPLHQRGNGTSLESGRP